MGGSDSNARPCNSSRRALPGLPPINFKMFSGYIPVAESRSIFYWFVESQKSPKTDPVVLWTNGGPGCSGVSGFMTEQGPFRPTASGDLVLNPSAWNKVANMVFIEQPAGVGFSYTTVPMAYNDSQAAVDNAAFVRGFLERYAAFSESAFYITSESYGGHYMPTLAKELVTTRETCTTDQDCPGSYCLNDKTKTAPYHCHGGKGFTPNFKGFMVGNPLTYMPYRDYGQYGTYAGHNLLPQPLWDQYLKAGCRENDSSKACQSLMNKFDELTAGLDPYALDFPVCTTTQAAGRHERHTLLKAIGKGSYFPQSYTPCDTDWATTYLNREDVQKALGVRGNVTWSQCSDTVSNAYSQTDVVAPMMPIYQFLIDGAYDLSILVYSGDDDSICATLGTQQWIWGLGYPVDSSWSPWEMDGQVSGYHVSFSHANKTALHFATVHGAGHMVPATRPAQSLEVLKKYLDGTW